MGDPFSGSFHCVNNFIDSPPFRLYDIFNHLLYHLTEYDKQGLAAYKSLDDYRLFEDGYVESLLTETLRNEGVHLYMGKVRLAMKEKTDDGKKGRSRWRLQTYCCCHVFARSPSLQSWRGQCDEWFGGLKDQQSIASLPRWNISRSLKAFRLWKLKETTKLFAWKEKTISRPNYSPKAKKKRKIDHVYWEYWLGGKERGRQKYSNSRSSCPVYPVLVWKSGSKTTCTPLSFGETLFAQNRMRIVQDV